MSAEITSKEKQVLDLIHRIKAAMDFEMKHHYINAIGNSGDFRTFIRNECRKALQIFRESQNWQSIFSLIDRYAFLDLPTRMNICKKIIKILNELENYYTGEMGDGKREMENDNPSPSSPPPSPTTNIQYFKGVGPALATKLKKLGIETIEDLLNYLPREHISYSEVTRIKELAIGEDVTIMGKIHKVSAFKSPRSNLVILSIFIKDNSGQIKISKFFQGNSAHHYLKQYKGQYPEGAFCICVGKVKADKFSKQKTIANAVIELISEDFSEEDRSEKAHTAQIVPIYPLTEGVSLLILRKLIHRAVKLYKKSLDEFLPQFIIDSNNLISYADAIEEIHFPSKLEMKNKAATRLLFNEMFIMQLRFLQLRRNYKKDKSGIKFNCFENGLVDKFINSLPFELTYAQSRVFYQEILPDMVSRQPMHRLLQGDVGSGKTVVAFLSLLVAVADGYQGAIMVPTEILAEQHYKKFSQWAQELGINIGLLIGKQRVKVRREILAGIQSGTINIVVGTHALIQSGVEFNKLGIVVIDEQHRFGVKQRELLAQKAKVNHDEQLQLKDQDSKTSQSRLDKAHEQGSAEPARAFPNLVDTKDGEYNAADESYISGSNNSLNVEKLFMTATPIPRTLALAMHGDLDMSEIDEMPLGRKPIETSIVTRKADAYKLIKSELEKSNQAYIVFPLIDESEALAAKAATVEYERLRKTIFKDYRLGLLHGKLKDEEKDPIMQAFRNKELDILIATTVIEVGVDVPDATVILIESSERFGLAQLHQLRGRVGRSDKQSYCLLASSSNSETSRARLAILEKTNNGFIIAQEDLRIRGAGDIIGLKQSGLSETALEGLVDQEELLVYARNSAKQLVDTNPELEGLEALETRIQKKSANVMANAG